MANNQKQSGAPAASHKKYTAKEAVSSEKHGGDKYSVESLRANMSTGGGEPIAKGEKWTTEKRRLQPRDPDTGHFTYNADAQYGLEYKQRAKGAVPVGAKGWVINPNGIKKGDKVVIGDKVWIAIRSMNKQEVIDFFKKYDESKGEYYAEKDNGKGEAFSSSFAKKRGRVSKEEKAGIASGQRVVGSVNMSSLSNTTKKEIADKFQEIVQGFNLLNYSTAPSALNKNLAANQAYNANRVAPAMATAAQNIQKAQQAQAAQPNVNAAGAGVSSSPISTYINKKAASNVGSTGGVIPFKKGQLPSAADLRAALAAKKGNK